MKKRTQRQRTYTYLLLNKAIKMLTEVKPVLDKVYYTLQPTETPIIDYKKLLNLNNKC